MDIFIRTYIPPNGFDDIHVPFDTEGSTSH